MNMFNFTILGSSCIGCGLFASWIWVGFFIAPDLFPFKIVAIYLLEIRTRFF